MQDESKALQGRVAVVTGASTGIGKAIALHLAGQGCRVVISARTLKPVEGGIGSLEETRREIEAAGGETLEVVADLARDKDLERLYDAAVGAWGGIDILINNAAAMFYYQPLFESDADRFDAEYRTNLRAPFVLIQRFGRHMAERGGGTIINLSSPTANLPPPPDPEKPLAPGWSSLTYAPTKAALNRLGAALARELAPSRVAVVTLYPGFTQTERLLVDPPPGTDAARAESPDGLNGAIVRVCQSPMTYTGRVLPWREVASDASQG